jgi:hypothetical protein
MIRAASWFCAEHCGVYAPQGSSQQLTPPGDCLALVARPVKYFSRMTEEARACLCAASLALRGAQWPDGIEIGTLSAGQQGVVRANQEYFRDYVANGRSLGRGNLFIYTLPTSALGEVAIALNLCGPCLFWQSEVQPIASMIHQAQRLCSDGEADAMLVFWSDAHAAICLAVDTSQGPAFPELSNETEPLELCAQFKRMVLQP